MTNNIFYTPKTLEELFKFHGSKFDEKTRKMMEIDYDTLFEGQKKAYSGIIHDVITREALISIEAINNMQLVLHLFHALIHQD